MNTSELIAALTSNVEISDEFGYWFAGFVDGEACFVLDIRKGVTNTLERKIALKIALRRDDKNVLEYIKQNIGGNVASKEKQQHNNPQSIWLMSQAAQCATILVPLFDKYKLHTKKAKEFVIWREMALKHFYMQLKGRNQIETDKLNNDFQQAVTQIKRIRDYEYQLEQARKGGESTVSFQV